MINVLVVDDEPSMLEAVMNMLGSQGFAVTSCANGSHAVELIERDNFDVVLADVVMEGLVGTALLDAIHDRRPDVPVIFMSSMPQRRVRQAVPGDYEFIRKPLEPNALADLIDRVVRTSNLHLLAGREAAEMATGRSRLG